MGKTRDTGNLVERRTVADAAYTILSSDKYVALTSITTARVFTLPAANSVTAGYELIVADESGSVTAINTLTINRAGSDTVNGATSDVMTSAYGSRRLFSNGSNAWGVDSNIVRLNATQTLTKKIFSGSIGTSGSAPTIAAGPGAGTSPTVTVTGNDIAGLISITVGASPTANSIVATITFNTTLLSVPKAILLTPASGNSGTTARIYVDQASTTTSVFVLKCGATVPSTGISAYYYLILQ